MIAISYVLSDYKLQINSSFLGFTLAQEARWEVCARAKDNSTRSDAQIQRLCSVYSNFELEENVHDALSFQELPPGMLDCLMFVESRVSHLFELRLRLRMTEYRSVKRLPEENIWIVSCQTASYISTWNHETLGLSALWLSIQCKGWARQSAGRS